MTRPAWRKQLLISIVLIGAALRVLFALFGATRFFGRADIRVDGDTMAWVTSVLNLLHTGTYTYAPGNEWGYFARMPGYSLFVGAFIVVARGNLDLAYSLVSWAQIALDALGSLALFHAGRRAFDSESAGLAAAGLYATYPFAIVWTPVVYAEALCVICLVWALFFLTGGRRLDPVWAGALVGFALLCRPQIILLAPLAAAAVLLRRRPAAARGRAAAVLFVAGFTLVYAPWPVRNFVRHGKFVLLQDLRAFGNWAADVRAFMRYIYAVKGEWEPQFSEIVTNRAFTVPAAADSLPGDLEQLRRAVGLAKTCGTGFSRFRGYWKAPIEGAGCDDEIARLFEELRASQIRNNPWNYWVAVPLQNLRKALFKSRLYDESGRWRRLGSALFMWRTLLILSGVVGALWLARSGCDPTGLARLALAYALVWYVVLCAGGDVLRNIEMRYLLPADVLLLLPAAGAYARAGAHPRSATYLTAPRRREPPA